MNLSKHLLMLTIVGMAHNAHTMNNDVTKDIVIGSAAAVVEVAIDQPLIYMKNMVQQGKPIVLKSRTLWLGAPGNAASLAPVTAIQVVANNAMLEQLKQHNTELNVPTKMGVAFTAGALSGLVSCPSENIMLYQQNNSVKLRTAMSDVFKYHGTRGMYRALLATMMRDGGFTAGFLGLRPIIKKQLEDTIPNKTALTLASGVSAGLAASAVTHPFDTVKTKMQANLHDRDAAKTAKIVAKIIRENSVRGLFKGFTARSTRVASAITIMGFVTDQLSAMLKN